MIRFKEFRTFWVSSFADLSVKGTENFSKIRGLIDSFNDLRRQIASGVGKTSDGLMSAIQFFTTPKGDLPHYSFIFRNMGPLGTEMKDLACSRFGTMLHLDIQKGKEYKKTSNFQNDIGGTTTCMKRLDISI